MPPDSTNEKFIWIAWEKQRRSVELATALGARLFILEDNGRFRYIKNIYKTISIVRKFKPDVLLVQNPSMILAFLCACFLRPLFSIPVVIDRHSNFLLTPQKRYWVKECIFNFLSYVTIRYADLTIVTNDDLAHVVRVLGGNPFVLPDKIPKLVPGVKKNSDYQNQLLIICSFGEDEPVVEIINAFKKGSMASFTAFISGNSKKAGNSLLNIPANIIPTGFLPENDFVDLLFEVDAVMVLTKMDYTLLCGCYEALAAEKPLITSDTAVLRQLFSKALFVQDTPDSIADGVDKIFKELPVYKRNTLEMKQELNKKWSKKFDELTKKINDL